ncbi:MAG: ATP-binding cassette domain-containing protein [Bacilli bacterium]|nr:ATP-binding cassette domain-containing protein [Bacilli bacterium]
MRYIKQEGIRDCGICCLLNIIRYYGGNIDIEKLRKMTYTDENGTSIYNLIRVSNEIGFESKAYRCSVNDLITLNLPSILYIKLNDFNHFVILTKIDVDKITIFDPIRGMIIYNFSEFESIWQNIVITFKQTGTIVKEKNYFDNYLSIIYQKNKKIIFFIIFLSVFCTLLSILLSFIIKSIFDYNYKTNLFLIFLFLLIIKVIIDYAKTNLSISLNSNLDYSLSEKIYNKIFSLPLLYHHTRPVGDITSRINDIYSIENFISLVTLSSFLDLMSIFIIIILFLLISFKIFILLLIITFLYLFIYFVKKSEENNYLNELKENASLYNSNFVENMLGIDSINNLNMVDTMLEKQKESKKKYLKSFYKYSRFISLQNSKFNFIELYGIFLIIFIGSFFVKDKKISIGDLSMVYSMLIVFFSSLKNLISLYKSYIESNISFRRLHNLLNSESIKDGNRIIKSIDKITFKNISYSYNHNKIISNFNFTINKGDNVLINGGSGTGKSTLLKLLTKELELKEGNIYINDIELNNIKINSIRNNICYVSQNEFVFNDSIKNNITMYKNIKPKEIEKVLKVTMLDKVLKKRNINLDFILEENGHNLSAGERQKVLLARTLLRNTNFVIFDETMNEIDIDSERKILERIMTEYKKSIVLVSHRNSNIDLFNKRVTI